MMTITRLAFTTLAATLAILLAGCGGNSADDMGVEPPTQPNGGIGRNGVAMGPIANFGSIVVNGVTYDTSTAAFTVNDSAATQDALKVGDVVIVTGTVDDNGTTGTATTVTFDDLVTGPVDSIDTAAESLVVLGQVVLVNAGTSFDDDLDPASLSGISVGQVIEVSGQVDADGNIVATRIEPKPAGTQIEVHGIVSGLDNGNFSFMLGNLAVDFSTAVLDDFPGGQVTEGDFVEAKGNSVGAAGELIATEVEYETLLPDAEDGDHLEAEGFITRFVSASDFSVAGIPVTTNASTEYEGGSAADLGLNVKVEVEGELDANGLLTATEIELRQDSDVEISGAVDSVDPAGNTLVILGIDVAVDTHTRLEDKSDARTDPLNLSDINAGDYIELRGSESPPGSGAVLATRLERDDLDTETELQGYVQAVSAPSFTVLGVTVSTDSNTVFRDQDDVVISSTEFFNQVAATAKVEVSGTEVSATSIAALEVELDD